QLGAIAKILPLWAKVIPEPGQRNTPDKGAGEGVGGKAAVWHARDTGRKRYERPHHRKHPRHKCSDFAPLAEPAICQIQILARNQNPTPLSFNTGPTKRSSNHVGDRRSDQVASGAPERGEQNAS